MCVTAVYLDLLPYLILTVLLCYLPVLLLPVTMIFPQRHKLLRI